MAATTLITFVLFIFVSTALPQCTFIQKFHLLDCAERELKSVPKFTTNPGVLTLTLKNNNLCHVNFTRLLFKFPNIKVVIVSGNPLDCLDVCNVDYINVLSDCACSTPTLTSSKPATKTSPAITTRYSTTSSRQLSSPSSTVQTPTPVTNYITSAALNSRISSQSLYIVIIVPALLFVLLILVFVSLCRKYRNHRAHLQLMEDLEMNELLIDHDEDEDDQVIIFDKEQYLQSRCI